MPEDSSLYTARDYTKAYKVPRSLKKVGKFYIPWRGGLLWDDLIRFLASAGIWTVIVMMVLLPVIRAFMSRLFGYNFSGLPFFLLWLIPPFVFTLWARRSQPHNMSLYGWLASWMKRITDDPIYHHGRPVLGKARTDTGRHHYEITVWTPAPDLLPDPDDAGHIYLPIAFHRADQPEQQADHAEPQPITDKPQPPAARPFGAPAGLNTDGPDALTVTAHR